MEYENGDEDGDEDGDGHGWDFDIRSLSDR